MRYDGPFKLAVLVVCAAALAACNTYQVIPKELQGQVNRQLDFQQVKNNPQAHRGETVVWGGEVLSATRLPNKTRIEVLQLPLTDDFIPAAERAQSQGRFLAFDRQGEILDPAVVKEGTRLTIVGQLQEPVSTSSDAGRQQYPVLNIRDMTVWDKKMSRAWAYPYYGPYYGHYYYGYRPYVFWDGTRVQSAAHSK